MTDPTAKTHREWRKEAKKARRKRIRQELARLRKEKEIEREKSPSYLLELEKKRLFEEFELEKESREREERHRKWLEDEEQAQNKWREEQRLKTLALEERQKEQERIRKEWEREQKKIKEQKEKLEALKKEEQRIQQETLKRINEFIYNGAEMPGELLVVMETNPGKEICSFRQKVGACRFGKQCSRNHLHYKVSNTLMFSNFYNHFTLHQNKTSEYDTDVSLEFEDSDMYCHFMDFYNDVVPEFKKFGEVTMVKVCCNTEIHLRGNVYVEYKTEREAAAAYQKFQARWYAGRQLSIEFVKIEDWASAVCGDFVRRRCSKGKSCNFLHVFQNPGNEFPVKWDKKKHESSHTNHEDEDEKMRDRHWRWSESPSRFYLMMSEQSAKSVKRRRRKSRSSGRKRKSRSSERKRRKSRSSRGRSSHEERRNSERKTERSERREKR